MVELLNGEWLMKKMTSLTIPQFCNSIVNYSTMGNRASIPSASEIDC